MAPATCRPWRRRADDLCHSGRVDELLERFKTTTDALDSCVFWHRRRTAAEVFTALAEASEALGIGTPDTYGDGGAVTILEAQVAELLGTEAAVFMPSGVMAQQAALRTWCDREGSRRVAMPDISHLLTHEDDGPRRLHGLEVDHLTTGFEVATADHLAAVHGRLGAVLVELPLRDAGCLLPTWEQLTELSEAARARGVRLHMDGARLWESQPFYDRPLAEIAGLFDSVYVSFYKGLAAPAGAAVAAEQSVVDELRDWRRRMGGTLYQLTPYAVGALLGLRDRLPKMAEYAAWARDLAAALGEHGISTAGGVPHTNTLHVFGAGDRAAAIERLLAVCEREQVMIARPWRSTGVPGMLMNELAVYDDALAHDPARVAGWLAESLDV